MKTRIIWVLLLLFGLAALAGAQTPEAPYKVTTLQNGLEVIVIENHTVPLVTIEIAAKNGAFTESPEYDGLSHLYEHMFFKANKQIPNQEAYLARTREMGMVFNGTTSEERVDYFFTLHKDSLRPGMVFMKNAIRYPLFLPDEMKRERQVVIGEFDRNEASPYYNVYRALQKKLWYYYSRKNPLGERNVILSATPEKMRTIQHRYYVPNNCALLVAGDVHADQIFSMAKQLYGDWQRSPNPFKEYPIPVQPPLKATTDTVVVQPVNVSMLMIGWHGPKALDDVKSTFAADVFSFILGQKTSQFQKNLVDSGIALQADLSYYTQQHTGPITASLVTPPGNILKAKQAFMDELAKFTDPGYFSDEQLKTAKTLLEVDAIYNQEKASDYVSTVSFWWAVTGLDYYRDYFTNLRAVTRQDIVNYVNRYLINKPHVIAAMVNASIKQQLQLTEGSLVK